MLPNPFDTSQVRVGEPDVILIGSRTVWLREIDVASPDYTARYTFRCGSQSFNVDGVHGADGWTFTIPTTGTTIIAGDYQFELAVTRVSDAERIVVAEGFVSVFLSDTDRRTHARIMVQKIESVLEGRADSDVASYTIKNRQITKLSPAELMKWRDYYKAEIERDGGSLTADSAKRKSKLRVRFV